MTTMNQSRMKEYLIEHIEEEFENIIGIMTLYGQMANVREYEMSLQLYYDKDGNQTCEPRIWLSSSKSNMGICLELYSIQLDYCDSDLDNDLAFEVFAHYQKYYTMNKDKFKVKLNMPKDFEVTANISFRISKREY